MSSATPPARPVPVRFTGSAGEFFGIWIVNLLLSIVTLGIYSAWAKVRTTRYFYQNTVVAGRTFDYHATGMQILIGRIIFAVGFVLFSLLVQVPVVGLVLIVSLLVLLPFLLLRSLQFNARMTSWSNVRFDFDGTVVGAFLAYLLWPFVALLSLFLAWPFAARQISRFAIGGHRLGRARFQFDSGIGAFYVPLLVAIGWLLGIAAIIAGIAYVFFTPADLARASQSPYLMAGVYLGLFMAFMPAQAIYQALMRNMLFAKTRLDGGHRFESDVSPAGLVWMTLSSTAAIILTLGLALPWVQVRLARFFADATAVLPGESTDDFIGRATARTMAVGAAYPDVEGIELGLPI